MSIQDILKKIIDTATLAVEEIEDEYCLKKEDAQKQMSERAQADQAKFAEKTTKALENITSKVDGLIASETKKKMLHARRLVVENIMQKTYELICSMDDEEYKGFAKNIAKKIKSPKGTLTIPKGKTAIFKTVFTDAEIKESADIEGGCWYDDKNKQVDYSFQTIIFSEFRDELETYIASQIPIA